MSSNTPDNYVDTVPDSVDMTQAEWEELGYHGQYYHVKDRQEYQRQNKVERRSRKREWMNEQKASRGCKVCGEDEPICLDWHHTSDDKEYSVGHMPNRDKSKEAMLREIEKCVVLCANCHRKHHAGLVKV